MSTRSLVLFIHVTAGTLLIGGSILGSPAIRRAVQSALSVEQLRSALTMGRPLGRLNPLSALMVMATGAYLASVSHWWTLGWIQVAATLWAVNVVTAALVVGPAVGRVVAAAFEHDDGPISPRLHALRSSPRWSFGLDLLVVNDAATLYLMTVRPSGTLPALAAVLGAHAAYGLFRAWQRTRAGAGAGRGLVPVGGSGL